MATGAQTLWVARFAGPGSLGSDTPDAGYRWLVLTFVAINSGTGTAYTEVGLTMPDTTFVRLQQGELTDADPAMRAPVFVVDHEGYISVDTEGTRVDVYASGYVFAAPV